MNKLDLFYAHALQGLCANPSVVDGSHPIDSDAVAKLAKRMAEALVRMTPTPSVTLAEIVDIKNRKRADEALRGGGNGG